MNEKVITLVTIVIPCFNTPREDLRRSVESVLTQDYDYIEVIIVDDCSDEPFSGLNSEPEYSGHELIHWISQPVNRGVAAARNAGVSQAKGAYVAFLDAGDWWDSKKITAQVAAINDSKNIGLVYCGAQFHPLDGRVSWIDMRELGVDAYRELLIRQAISGSASAAMVRRDIIIDLGGFETEVEIPEDRDMWLRIARNYGVVLVSNVLTHIEVNPKSRSAESQVKIASYKTFLRVYDAEIRNEGVMRDAYSHYHIVIAKKFYTERYRLRSLKHILLAGMISPQFVVNGVIKLLKR